MVESVGNPWLWAGFILLVGVLLALDLGLLNRRDHVVSTREALGWMVGWASLAALFTAFVAWRFGGDRAADFFTGYLLELSLSVDNLFVFVLVFSAFAIPAQLQHRVLYWGILTALLLRGTMIIGGTALLSRFHWLIYVFGAFLVMTGAKLLFQKEEDEAPAAPAGEEPARAADGTRRHAEERLPDGRQPGRIERSLAFRCLRRLIPSTHLYDGNRFWLRVPPAPGAGGRGRWVATPLLLALVLIEISDVVFALDSVPAIFGVTIDPFIVFTSNIFAILGLRSLYFALARLMGRFQYLHVGLAAVLIFIGAKMGASGVLHVPSLVALGVVLSLIGVAIGWSLWRGREAAPAPVP